MERVVQLLQAHDYRQALVRLWVLGSNPTRLKDWERIRPSPVGQITAQTQFLSDLQKETLPTVAQANAMPLALIHALDEFIAGSRTSTLPAMRPSNKTKPIQEEGNGYWVVPVIPAARRRASLTRQTGNLGTWFHHHAVLPSRTAHGLEVKLSFTQSTVDDALQCLWLPDAPSLKVWIAHFNDTADVVWDRSLNEAQDWRAQHVAPQEERKRSLLATMVEASKAGAHFVVFPEFTLDLYHRRFLQEQLRSTDFPSLILVVAGSFHETTGGNTFNTAPLYGAQGHPIFTHNKLRIFGDIVHGAEHVSVGNTIQVLVTPVGCLTVLICKDFIDAHASVESLLTEVPVDWVLVPSYGDEKTIRLHKDRAKALAVVKTGSHTVVAQTLNTAMLRTAPPTECVRGFGHIANHQLHEPQVGETGGVVSFALEQQGFPKPPP